MSATIASAAIVAGAVGVRVADDVVHEHVGARPDDGVTHEGGAMPARSAALVAAWRRNGA